jgi:hypothetical protein
MLVVDGSVVPASPQPNPELAKAAVAEHVISEIISGAENLFGGLSIIRFPHPIGD